MQIQGIEKRSAKLSFLGLILYCCVTFLEATTPMTTLPPPTLPPLNSWFKKFGTALHRHGKKLDVKAMAIVEGKIRN